MDRRSLMVGFVGFAGFGVLAPTLLPMPLEARGLLLGAGSLAMTGAAVMAWDDRQYVGHRSALRRSEQVGAQERLTAQHAYQSAVQDSLAEIQLFQWVMEQPSQFRPALMAEHDLYKFVPQVIETQATTVEPTGLSVSMPKMLMEQSSIGDQNEASIDLDTTWFAAWELRSGLICGESGDGKCLGKGTPVVMADMTTKPVEDIRVGDLLMGDDSKPRKVLALGRGRQEMFRVTPVRGGDSFTCNRSHILSLISGYGKAGWEVGKIYDISVDDYLKLPKTIQRFLYLYRVSADYIEQPVPVDPYYVGLWLGDGTCKWANNITNPDQEVENYLRQFAESMDLTVENSELERCPTWRLSSKQSAGIGSGRTGYINPLLDAMRSCGLSIDGAKFVPEIYLSNSREVRLNLLAGFLDTDGYLFHGSCFEVVQKNHDLADQIIYLARSLGFMICRNKDKIVSGTVYKRFTINGDTHLIPTKIKRKQALPRQIVKSSMHTGFTLESLGEGDYYGFTIDGNHRFLLGDFTVTHNTKTLIYVLARFLQVNAGGQCEVYIGDPDYGSSHGDAEPNNWLGLKLGTHVAVEPQDIYRMVSHVSGIVDARAGATAKATSDGNGKPKFPPVLFILDEAPAVMNMLDKESKDDFKAAISNILRRGLKQNVTFKLGTQSLAVGSLALPQDVLRQVETVILWRAAQVKENYTNLGIQPKQIDAACDAIGALPRKVGDKFVCAVFVGKQLQVKGIPTIGDIAVSTDSVSGDAPKDSDNGDDIYGQILTLASAEAWDLVNGLSDAHRRSLKSIFDRLTGQNLTTAGIDALIDYLKKL